MKRIVSRASAAPSIFGEAHRFVGGAPTRPHGQRAATIMSAHFKLMLPTGVTIGFEVSAESIRSFISRKGCQRSCITCYRCGETGHYRSECSNWKTRLCWHHMHGACNEPNCPFAHGGAELRTPCNFAHRRPRFAPSGAAPWRVKANF